MISLGAAARKALKINMGLKKNERLLVITNKEKETIGNEFIRQGEKICKEATKLVYPTGKRNGEEPPSSVSAAMKHADVIMMPTTKSLSHTKARRDATKKGARIASMPGITEEIMARTFSADYKDIRKTTQKLCRILEGSKKIRVTSKAGTDIMFTIGTRTCHGKKGGIFNKPGYWGNLPCGEACFAPIEGTTKGVYVIDCGVPHEHALLKKPITIHVENGLAVSIKGDEKASALHALLKKNGPLAFSVAELGIGTHPQAKITGITLEEEKKKGTAHIALGNNKSFGGHVDVPIHLDGVMKKVTIKVDDKIIIRNGTYII